MKKQELGQEIKVDLGKDVKIYSVDEITTYIKNLINQDKILQDIFIKGELSNFYNSDRGHMYFSLKDENSIIKCIMFSGINQNLDFAPEDGMKVIAGGHIDVYKQHGKYQIIVKEMYLAGKGELYIKFLQLKTKLEKEGLFKEERKKSFPKYPQIIGIVTSPKGSVIRDIINVIRRRYPHIKLIIFPSSVQGDNAKNEIVQGIKILNEIGVEIIIVARGGGSFEDLWPFNEEIVARAVYDSHIPIISGVGHDTDFTIIDFVSDKRAPTPSTAAELVVPNEEEILNNLVNLGNKLYKNISKMIEFYKQQIVHINSRPVFKRPFSLIEENKQILDERVIQLKQAFKNETEILKRYLKDYRGRLDALNPYSVLNRGYSITMKGEKVVSSVKDINSGDVISTIVKDGEIKSKIQSKNEKRII